MHKRGRNITKVVAQRDYVIANHTCLHSTFCLIN